VSKIEVTPKGKQASYSINLVWLSTDFFKSLLVSRIRTPMDQPGSFIVPDDIDEDYCKQLVPRSGWSTPRPASRNGSALAPEPFSRLRGAGHGDGYCSTSSASRKVCCGRAMGQSSVPLQK
jgi:hypothetical protein